MTVLAEGDFGLDEVRRAFSEVAERTADVPTVRILVFDLSSGFEPTSAELRGMVATWAELFPGGRARIALVVERELHFGLGRMASVFAEVHALPVGVFRERDEALGWLAHEGTAPDDALWMQAPGG